MNDFDFRSFANHYTHKDFEIIKFDWNGQHGDKFQDNNVTFRTQLSEFLIPYLSSIKLELIKDLYLEHAKYSREAWAVYRNFHLFAQELLSRGGINYIYEYLEGSIQSFDAGLASARIVLTPNQKEIIYTFIVDTLKTEQDENKIKLLEIGKNRFERAQHTD